MQKLRVVYFGTPDFSARILEKLLTDPSLPIETIAVVTQPDKPVGKKKIMTASPVKEIAKKYHVSLYESLSELENLGVEKEGRPRQHGASSSTGGEDYLRQNLNSRRVDLALLFAYGKIIPADLLALPRLGFWNIHPSLLPQFRGPSPIAYPLILGEKKTGVTIMKMDEKVDHGPIIGQADYNIKATDTRADLEKNLSDLGYELFRHVILTRLWRGKNPAHDQDDKKATFTYLLKREDGFVPFDVLTKSMISAPLVPAEFPQIIKEYLKKTPNYKLLSTNYRKYAIYNLFRGLSPWPGVYTIVKINGTEKRLKITDLHLENDRLVVDKVQLEGKNEVDLKTFNTAYHVF